MGPADLWGHHWMGILLSGECPASFRWGWRGVVCIYLSVGGVYACARARTHSRKEMEAEKKNGDTETETEIKIDTDIKIGPGMVAHIC